MNKKGKYPAMLWILPIEGQVIREVLPDDNEPPLDRLKEIVGGWVEQITVVYLNESAYMFVNEEGIMRGLLRNKNASIIAGRSIVGQAAIWTRAGQLS